MTSRAARPSRGRPPRGAPQLSIAAIAQAALAEIDDQGLAGLGVRSVARRLGVDPKSLYNHVDGKEGLLDAVTDHLLTTMRLPEPTGALETDIDRFARAFRAHALRHPQAAGLVMTRQTRSRASLVPLDVALSILVTAGCDHRHAVRLLRMIMAMLIGTILREADAAFTFAATTPAEIAHRIAALESSGLPTLTAAARHIARVDHDAEFDFVLAAAIRIVTDDLAGRAPSGPAHPG
ncbi:TetR/AcrR family transcriptional regulator [Jidongwangia harbinensis]|uniref:TetR/AcrR family transcriptional regulator n=1 Tax=Jidongwangia harbinensis TaxID=2878561 RepID=UPI001CD9B760|nr:TetR/AcrR family transcriptional regulator C-terminal domain-containing protein [Jidongwangia harbinensis]MCA2214973.1 TetR/AcrR family transcriptional regulator C-terminal domain-containing protein [Jidongwangia harbinensis]